MYLVNRHAVVVELKQPFVDWLNATARSQNEEFEISLAEANRDPSVYLLKEHMFVPDAEKYLKKRKRTLFQEQLNGWYVDRKLWPKGWKRLEVDAWLSFELHTGVTDIEDAGLFRE